MKQKAASTNKVADKEQDSSHPNATKTTGEEEGEKHLYSQFTLEVQTWQIFQTQSPLQQTSKFLTIAVVKNLIFGGGCFLAKKGIFLIFRNKVFKLLSKGVTNQNILHYHVEPSSQDCHQNCNNY